MKQRLFYGITAVSAVAGLCLSLCLTPALAQGSAPVAENLEITTYRGVSVDGELAAVDPDGDVLTFLITTPPTKGTVEVDETGKFVYTPAEGRRGKDYFGYVAHRRRGPRRPVHRPY